MRRVPTNELVASGLVPMFKLHLELCLVEAGQTVLVFTNTATNPSFAAGLVGAAGLIGAEVVQIVVPTNNEWMRSRAIIDAWKSSDLVYGILASTDRPWVYSDAHNEALDSGTRTLMIQNPEDILARLFPTQRIRERGLAGGNVLDSGSTLRVTSDAGTNLTLSKVGRKVAVQYGVSDVSGRWDHWPSGLVNTAPIEETAEGTLVIDEGDILVPLARYVGSPIRLTFRDGKAVKIEGGADASIFREYFEAAHDERAYLVSHVGWGTDDRARWNELGLRYWEGGGWMDALSYYGNMMISFGSNFYRNLGGKNTVDFHFDVPTRNHSFWVDDVQVIDRGRFLLPELA
jgi:2,5-dihydroxypyridine 5,6-dioxygenase